jgi:hypothetical protein
MFKYLLFIAGIILTIGCQQNKKQPKPEEGTSRRLPKIYATTEAANNMPSLRQKINELCQAGDIVMRTGKDQMSQALQNFNINDKRFSHCGVAVKENNEMMIVHCYSGLDNPSGIIMKQKLADFLNDSLAINAGLFRFKLNSTEKDSFIHKIQAHYASKVVFDNEFNMNDDSKLYCSEMIAKSIAKVSQNKITIKPTKRPGGKIKTIYAKGGSLNVMYYYSLEDIYQNAAQCEEINLLK